MAKSAILSVWCFAVLLSLTLINKYVEAGTNGPAEDFHRHSIVQPIVHHARTKREISHTRGTDGAHHSELTIRLNVDGEEYLLDLRLNKDLITDNHVVKYKKDGRTVVHKPTKEEIDLCQYFGRVRGKEGSWVALSTCEGVRGVIYDGKVMKFIEPVKEGIQSDHYLYDHRDLSTNHSCGHAGHSGSESGQLLKAAQRISMKSAKLTKINRYKRNTEESQVRSPYNANSQSRYVELALVADRGVYAASGHRVAAVHRRLKDLANIVNAMYAPLNIFVALVGVVIWTEQDEIQLESIGEKSLESFLRYRRTRLSPTIPNDTAQLLTAQTYAKGVVGNANMGLMCTHENSGALISDHTKVLGLLAATMAHELGHSFGMEHDGGTCDCPDVKCIMSNVSTAILPIHWSSCSISFIGLAFERGMDYCLRNKPKSLFDSPTCGNGFLEPGEQCDCGLRLDRDEWNQCMGCCHADTCVLRDNATCASGECCNLETCRPKSAGTTCRAAQRECDLPEYCTGHSEFCPDDVFKMDSTPCAKGQAYCARGQCSTHAQQCRLLWGVTGEKSDDRCYTQNNRQGKENGNCGLDLITKEYKQCKGEDSLCGLLHCRHLNEKLDFGSTHSRSYATFINDNGVILPCRTANIDLGLNDADPGLVPDGAKCGEDKMCMKNKCIPVETVRLAVSRKHDAVCPSNCSGHGVCNSEGLCHCEVGFAPPLCAAPGPGGSYISGPATDPSFQRNFMVAMYVIFLGIVPTILLLLFLIYYARNNVIWWKKPRKVIQSPQKSSLQRRISRSASRFASNFQNNGQNGAPPVHVHTLSNPDDMSSSLLRSDSDSPSGNINPSVNFFGNFKGFSLTPMEKNQPAEQNNKPEVNKSAKITPVHRSPSNSQSIVNNVKPVLRTAPPLPVVPKSVTTSPSVKRTNSSVQDRIKALITTEKTENISTPVQTPARPVISSPILEASTCSAKELISPLQSKTLGPVRTAPMLPNIPNDVKRPLSMHSASGVPQKPLPEEPKKVKEGISLNRIASFLKQDKTKEKERNPVERSHSLPKNANNQVRVPKIDKTALRNLQISNPIPQKDIELPVNTVSVVSDSEDGDDQKSFVNRTQSMRTPTVQKPVLQSFGSMRQAPGVPRPTSIVGRPTAPPPPLPNDQIYQHPKPLNDTTDYVDCIEEKQAPLAHIDEESNDNIYAIIEESPEKHSKTLPRNAPKITPPITTIPQPPPEGYHTPKPVGSNSGSTESMGLLGEIVNEIQNRNFDSIYSAATLARKKKERENAQKNRDSMYMNTEHYKTPESVYSAKSNVSTTSSGYLHPSAVNVPTYMNKNNNDESKEVEKTPPSPTLKNNSKIPTFARQVTPPGLRTTSTFRNGANSPKNINANTKIVNSPDVVSSCAGADTKTVKAPDVINNNKLSNEPSKVKPVSTRPSETKPPTKPAPPDKKPTPPVEKKPTLKTTPSLKPVNSSSSINKTQTDKHPPLNRANSKVDSNVKAIADNLNKSRPKIVPKPPNVVQRTDSNVKPNSTKLTAKPSNVASLQQKFENRKSIGKEINVVKK